MGRITYKIVAAVAIFLAAIPAIYRSQSEPTGNPTPRISGLNNTVLFLTTDPNGLSNVHLATSFALLEHHPSVQVHYASWPRLSSRLDRISAAVSAKTRQAKKIHFHQLPGPDVGAAAVLAGKLSTDMPHAPGSRGWSTGKAYMTAFLAPWSAEDHYDIYARIMEILKEVDPAVAVLDTMLAPAFDAVRTTNRRHVILSPNHAAQLAYKQPWMKGFWKYPA